MFTAYVVATVLTAAVTAYSAIAALNHFEWILANMTKYGVPHSWLSALGSLKAAGALGLVVGIGVPLIGTAASVGLILYFVGAIVTVMRAHWYSHIPYPAAFLLLVVVSLTLRPTS